ncbi:hypothetical protein [Bradyrhizobium uaiense]|uniref:Uncharacterized protein n=1 Tax=Bradyrhizobium uaiense TaxID=2594946 RepID=A0A6P1B8H7_9BRAD|nr:hypothetical protein [Bradyrhizobium uaiense]NEU94798.1 hypothetical protein [Bradyrhizobium uaiense]
MVHASQQSVGFTKYSPSETEQKSLENRACGASREWTVAELIESRIADHSARLAALRSLSDSLPASFLNSGSSRISALLK